MRLPKLNKGDSESRFKGEITKQSHDQQIAGKQSMRTLFRRVLIRPGL
jgi:hypothetical protein